MSEITKESRADRAIACHNKGYNCAQSVAFAFLDKVDIDPETLFKVTEGLGLGMGGMEGTCGAISAAAVLAGLKISTADLKSQTPRELPIRHPKPASQLSRRKTPPSYAVN
jgi:hypothetical protein